MAFFQQPQLFTTDPGREFLSRQCPDIKRTRIAATENESLLIIETHLVEQPKPLQLVGSLLPFPDAASGAVQLTFQAQGQPLRAVFVTDENHGFTAVIALAEETA